MDDLNFSINAGIGIPEVNHIPELLVKEIKGDPCKPKENYYEISFFAAEHQVDAGCYKKGKKIGF